MKKLINDYKTNLWIINEICSLPPLRVGLVEGEGVATTPVSVGLIPCTDLLGFIGTAPLPPLPFWPLA